MADSDSRDPAQTGSPQGERPPPRSIEATGVWPEEGALTPAPIPAWRTASGGRPAVPGYTILDVLGRGGMGVVYKALQTGLNRVVALKMILSGAHASPEERSRFRVEAEAVARLHHPHIVQIYHTGEHDGHPFFSLEFCPSGSLADRLCGTPQPSRQAAELVEALARAMHYAHERGIVHRDLKPANILLASCGRQPPEEASGGRKPPEDEGPSGGLRPPLAELVPKVSDFGLAKHLEGEAGRTPTGAILGTPSYMAPEQADGKARDVGPAADVYALGAILYECLTGRPPFRGATDLDTLLQVQRDEPVPPSRLRSAVPRDLNTVCLKCLHKEPTKRYTTAEALAEDLQLFLADRPVLARRASALEQTWRWFRRNPGVALATTAAALLLVTVAVVTSLSAWWLNEEQKATREQLHQTQQAELKTRHHLFKVQLAQARASRWTRRPGQRFDSWQALAEAAALARELDLGEDHQLELRNEAIACLALVDLRLDKGWPGYPPGSLGAPAFDARLVYYARGDRHGTITVHQVDDDRELARLPRPGPRTPEPGLDRMIFSPDGELLAVRYHQLLGQDTNFLLWDWRQGQILFRPPFALDGKAMDFSPDGRHLALAQPDGTLTFQEARTGKVAQPPIPGLPTSHLAYHPDGTRIALASNRGGEVQVRDVATGRLSHRLSHPAQVLHLAWHPDGLLLAASCADRNVYLWDTRTDQQHAVLRGHRAAAFYVTFAPDGDLLLSSAWDATSRLWDPWTGRELTRFAGAHGQFRQDGRRLANWEGSILALWEVAHAREYRTLPQVQTEAKEQFWGGHISPDGRWLALGTNAGVRLWDLAGGKERAFLPVSRATDVRFHPSGKELFTCGQAGLYRWPVQTQDDVCQIGPPHRLPIIGRLEEISLDREGHRLAVLGAGGARVLDLDNLPGNLPPLRHGRAGAVALSPDGQWVATATHNNSGVKVWEVHSGREHELIADVPRATVTFSPDGRWLVTGSRTEFGVWAVGSWQLARTFRREQGVEHPGYAAFARDGSLLAITFSPFVVHLIDPVSWRLLAELQAPETDPLRLVGFNPTDGSQLVVSAEAGGAWVWDLRRIRDQLREIELDWAAPPYRVPTGDVKPVRVKVDLGRLDLGWDPQAYLQRADGLARRGQWAEAAEDQAKAIELHPLDHFTWHNDSVLRLELGDVEGYRRVCREMLRRFGQTTNPNIAERTAKTCLLAPDAIRDYKPVLRLAQAAVTGTEKHVDYRSFLLARGMADYRTENFAGAIKWLRECLSPESENPYRDGLAYLFLAMAHHRHGQAEEARQALAKARTREEKLPKLDGGDVANWPDWLRFHIVRREVEDLLGKAGTPPRK